MKDTKGIVTAVMACLLLLTVAVTATQTDSRRFSDVFETDWYAQSVHALTEGGLLKGYADGTFRPGETMTVGEYLTLIARCVGEDRGQGDTGYWCGATVQMARNRSWLPASWNTAPIDAASYGQPITRELATYLLMKGLTPLDQSIAVTSQQILDFDKIDEELRDTIMAAYHAGVTQGMGEGYFAPQTPLSRGQAAELFFRAGYTVAATELPVQVTVNGVNSWRADGKLWKQVDVTLSNHNDQAITDWTLTLTAGTGETVSQYWNCGVVSQNGTITVTPVNYNTSIPVGGQTEGIGIILTEGDWKVNSLALTWSNGERAVLAFSSQSAPAQPGPIPTESVPPVGALHVSGTKLVDEMGNAVQLRGVSTHGLAWYPQYVNEEAFRTLRDDWGVNVIRLALYTEEYGGYCSGGDRTQLKQRIDDGVQYATKLGMYVIIDWHILRDGDPRIHQPEAETFFGEMSEKYAGYDNVLYEICNEPTSSPWSSIIKPYAEAVLGAIRNNDPNGVVLVGTNTWSQDVEQVTGDRLSDSNVMYVFHFYAATHGETYRQKLRSALDAGIPVFVSECNICDASGRGGNDVASAQAWMQLLNKRQVSFVAWNLSNKNETSALLQPTCTKTSGWAESDLSETGKWFRAAILQRASE